MSGTVDNTEIDETRPELELSSSRPKSAEESTATTDPSKIAINKSSAATGSVRVSVSADSSLADEGEIRQLLNSVEQDDASPILSAQVVALLKQEPSFGSIDVSTVPVAEAPTTPSTGTNVLLDKEEIWYGHRLTETEAQEAIEKNTSAVLRVVADDKQDTKQGLTWYVTVIPDNFFSDGKLRRGLDKKDFDPEEGKIKPRRASLPITVGQLIASITKVRIVSQQNQQYRYIFNGFLNGWPGLRTMELLTLEQRRNHTSVIPKPKELLSGQILWWKTWEAPLERSPDSTQNQPDDPLLVFHPERVYRAKMRCPPWTAFGWSPDSQGFCFWYEPQHENRLSYGTNMLQTVQDGSNCTHVHMIAHRYVVQGRESPRDRLTYHSVCLLEWDHGSYCTVAELAFFNGLGGYKGKSNWYHDRDEPITKLYQAFPPEMILPWKSNRGEIRCFDLPHVKSLLGFKQYLDQYRNARFLDPQIAFSHTARLTFRSKRMIAKYLLNYMSRDPSYAELKRNCQTFAADLTCFLAGKKGVQPFHPVSRIDYQNRTYLFLYDAHLYT